MSHLRLWPLASAIVWSAAACRPDLELAGMPCPCTSGYTCIEGRCITSVPPSGSGGSNGATSSSSGSCTPKVSPSDLRVLWRTPNTIHVEWTPGPDAETLLGYELIVAKSEQDALEQRWEADGGTARRFDGGTNPELNGYSFDDATYGEIVTETTADDLEPQTAYFLSFVARDTTGCAAVLPAMGTLPASTEGVAASEPIVLFDDPPSSGSNSTSCEVIESVECFGGSGFCLRSLPEPSNYPNTGWVAMEGIGLPEVFTETQFQNAYLEMHYRTDTVEEPEFNSVWLTTGPINMDTEVYRREPFPLKNDAEWHRIQIPLRVLDYAGTPLTLARLNENPTQVFSGFNVGIKVPFSSEGHVWVDKVSVRW